MQLLLALFLLSEVPISLGETEMAYIDTALQAINLRVFDLSYEKKRTERDSFRLVLVDRFMDHPLEFPGYADSCEAALRDIGGDPWKLLLFVAANLGFGLKGDASKAIDSEITKFREKGEIPPEFHGIEEDSLREGLEILYASMALAKRSVDEAFSSLSRGERDTLLYEALELWSDEDDSSDDSLGGLLLREKGLKLDTTWEIKSKVLLGIARKVKMDSLLWAGAFIARGFDLAMPYLSAYRDREVTSTDFYSPLGRIKIGGPGDDRYSGDYALLFDSGGDDLYEGRCGGAIGDSGFVGVSILIDLGGDDLYRSRKGVSQGSGFMGVGLLYDGDGDDLYTGSVNSQGTGLFGVGFLIDSGGDDRYISAFFSQGSGNFGVGVLYDGGGDDSYRADDWTQGFGSVWGYGLLVDMEGDDSYYAGGHYIHHPLLPDQYRSFAQGFGMGWRKDASGGIGFLYDGKGNDSYYVEVYGQGTSYWYSLGMLVDSDGNDTYSAAEYAQGAGIHLSCGLLVDRKGNDHYFSRHGPSQGEGHDFAVGILIDSEGNDAYEVSGGQGIGLNNSVGLFVDSKGDDTYTTREKGAGQGWANWSRGTAGVGIFLDLGGDDRYPEGYPGKNNSFWISGTYGAGIDTEASR